LLKLDKLPQSRSARIMRFPLLNYIKKNIRIDQRDHHDAYLRIRSSSMARSTSSTDIGGAIPSAARCEAEDRWDEAAAAPPREANDGASPPRSYCASSRARAISYSSTWIESVIIGIIN